jgi:hypothetical protein
MQIVGITENNIESEVGAKAKAKDLCAGCGGGADKHARKSVSEWRGCDRCSRWYMRECLERVFKETDEIIPKKGEGFTCPKCRDSFTRLGQYLDNSCVTSVEVKMIKAMVTDIKSGVSQMSKNLEKDREIRQLRDRLLLKDREVERLHVMNCGKDKDKDKDKDRVHCVEGSDASEVRISVGVGGEVSVIVFEPT